MLYLTSMEEIEMLKKLNAKRAAINKKKEEKEEAKRQKAAGGAAKVALVVDKDTVNNLIDSIPARGKGGKGKGK